MKVPVILGRMAFTQAEIRSSVLHSSVRRDGYNSTTPGTAQQSILLPKERLWMSVPRMKCCALGATLGYSCEFVFRTCASSSVGL